MCFFPRSLSLGKNIIWSVRQSLIHSLTIRSYQSIINFAGSRSGSRQQLQAAKRGKKRRLASSSSLSFFTCCCLCRWMDEWIMYVRTYEWNHPEFSPTFNFFYVMGRYSWKLGDSTLPGHPGFSTSYSRKEINFCQMHIFFDLFLSSRIKQQCKKAEGSGGNLMFFFFSDV